MYVAEVAPRKIRGTLVSIYQLAITMGILISYLVNFALHEVDNNWRWMFATGLIPSIVFFTGLIFIPESPRWLVKAGFREKAIIVLKTGESLTEEQMIEYCQGKLARYKIPKSVNFMESLPRTAAGKVLKRELRAQFS